jgi:hypothetical protein
VDPGKHFPPAQFRRVLVNRRGGIFVLRRAVAQHHQRGLRKIVTVHGIRLAQPKSGVEAMLANGLSCWSVKIFASWRLNLRMNSTAEIELI